MAYFQPNPTPYRSHAATNAQPYNFPRRRFPLPDYCPAQHSAFAIEQDYEMLLSSFPPAPRNTLATASSVGSLSAYTKSILTGYSQPSPTGAGQGQFSASFHVVPESWDEFKTLPYTFPGFPGLIGQTGSRNIFTDAVTARIRHDYFVVDKDNVISTVASGTPSTATSLLDSGGNAVNVVYKTADIPIYSKSIFVVAYGGTPDYTNRTQSLIKAGGELISGVTWYETLPTKASYQSWITNATSQRWTSTVWNGTSNSTTYGQLIAEDSRLEPYAGNIIDRVTIYVLAK